MDINYEYYKVFYYVARYGSFTAAAEALMNNQPNITRIIKKLEDGLGCRLFVRQRHGVALTPAGERLYAHVSVAFEHILRGEQELEKERGLQAGTVTVAASEIALHCVLLETLRQFRKAHSGIRIRICNHSTPQAIRVLQNGLADFAVVTQPFELPAELSAEVLRSVQEIPICSRAFPFADGFVLTEKELRQYPLIGLGEKTGSFAFYAELFRKMELAFAPEVEAATADQILPLVRSDLGIGFLPVEFMEHETTRELRRLRMDPPIPPRDICLLKRRDVPMGIAASELERMILLQAAETERKQGML